MAQAPILILPGYGDSGPEHWQSLWERARPGLRRVVQRDWLMPRLDDWLHTLGDAVAACPTPPVLVAHSLGCALVAHRVQRGGGGVRGALLVAPSDVDALAETMDVVRSFSPLPLVRFPFPSVVVASDDDLYTALSRAEHFARAWGSRFVRLSGAGHINADSGFGPWPDGERLLDELLRSV